MKPHSQSSFCSPPLWQGRASELKNYYDHSFKKSAHRQHMWVAKEDITSSPFDLCHKQQAYFDVLLNLSIFSKDVEKKAPFNIFVKINVDHNLYHLIMIIMIFFTFSFIIKIFNHLQLFLCLLNFFLHCSHLNMCITLSKKPKLEFSEQYQPIVHVSLFVCCSLAR